MMSEEGSDRMVMNSSPELPSVEAHWSERAAQRLRLMRIGGVLLTIAGALAFVIGTDRDAVWSSFLSNGGLTLLVTGVAVIVAVTRTQNARPDQSFRPGSIVAPRMWFVLLWLAGGGLAFMLLALDATDTTEQILMLAPALILMITGGLWLLRWLSGQLTRRWPSDVAAPLNLTPGWTITWAGVWGLFSTVVAFVVESLPIVLLAIIFHVTSTRIPRSSINSVETFSRLLRNPVLLMLAFIGAVIAAPIVEEGIKAFGLRWLRRWIRQPADGWLLGLSIGFGFGILEGAFNLDAAGSWFAGGWVRLAALLLHGLATSLSGLGYARSLRIQQRGPLWRGYRNAVILHGLWNASALGIAVAAGATGLGAFSIRFLLACGGLVLFIGLIAFMVMLVRRVARAGVEASIQEGFQLAGAMLPAAWSPMKFNLGWRLVNSRPVTGATTTTSTLADEPPTPTNNPS